MENITTFDIGQLNSAVSIWKNKNLSYFSLFDARVVEDVINFLDSNIDKFLDCTHLFVEQQMVSNHKAVRIEVQIYTWFAIKLPRIERKVFPARRKYINIDKNVYNTKAKRKKWAVQHVEQTICEQFREQFMNLKKKDDVADAIVIGEIILDKF